MPAIAQIAQLMVALLFQPITTAYGTIFSINTMPVECVEKEVNSFGCKCNGG